MKCGSCQVLDDRFNQKSAEDDLKEYRKDGLAKRAQILVDLLISKGVEGKTLLDIGGGIGSIQLELLKSGLASATSVEASSAYLQAAQAEAKRQGHLDRLKFIHSDFTKIRTGIPVADFVTLDRVICCYKYGIKLVALSSEVSGEFYGLIYPRDNRLAKILCFIHNFIKKIFRNDFRLYIHSSKDIRETLKVGNFNQIFYDKLGIWRIEVYEKSDS